MSLRTLTPAELAPDLDRLRAANHARAQRYAGVGGGRQPVHTVYGGAHLFKANAATKLGGLALWSLEQYVGDDAAGFARAMDLHGAAAPDAEVTARHRIIFDRVREKLSHEPIEDFRIDFEDGYGNRPDTEEDGHAVQAATEVAKGMAEETLPPFIGFRIKPLDNELAERAVRTLDLFLTTLAARTGGALPAGFVVTLPKITAAAQVSALADLLDRLEPRVGIAGSATKIELMIETPQAIIGPRGEVALPHLIEAGRGRCASAHFGTYDYTACCGITAAHQRIDHPACDFAKHVLQVALADTGVTISDGATNIMPIPRHRGDAPFGEAQVVENRDAVHDAWRLHVRHVRHALTHGFYQGWDLHPAQLPARYAAVFEFFLEGFDAASARLKSFVAKAAQATLAGRIFDDAATGQGLLNYFLRGIACGCVTEGEVLATGLTLDELRSRSFVQIVQNRRG